MMVGHSIAKSIAKVSLATAPMSNVRSHLAFIQKHRVSGFRDLRSIAITGAVNPIVFDDPQAASAWYIENFGAALLYADDSWDFIEFENIKLAFVARCNLVVSETAVGAKHAPKKGECNWSNPD